MTHALVAAAWLCGQAGLPSTFDLGAVVGRVCHDLDGDGRCGADEPGVAAARVVLESGLTAVTDADGRWHLAGVSSRSPDTFAGGRLLPGRHRARVDTRWLSDGATVLPAGATFEVPMGGLAVVDFAVRLPERTSRTLRLADGPPPSLVSGQVRLPLRFEVPPERELRLRGVTAEAGQAVLSLAPGHTVLPVALVGPGVVDLFTWAADVVPRPSSALVVPRRVEPLGRLSLGAEGLLRVQLPPDTSVEVDGTPLVLDAGGRAARQTTGDVTVALELPGVGRWTEALQRRDARGVFAVGLLDLEVAWDTRGGGVSVQGRGAGALRARWGGFNISADLDVRDADVETAWNGEARTLLLARRADVFARQLDASRTPLAWSDASAAVASNAAGGRLRVEVARDGLGRLGYGSTRLFFADAEVGRAHRAVEGGYLSVSTPEKASFGASLRAVAAPSQEDTRLGLTRRPAHERFDSTGGSLFFLGHASVVQGSEVVRVEWRDPVSGLASRELHLTRDVDYALDALSGRVLLTQPLSFLAEPSLLEGDPLSAGVSPVLVVDYEYLDVGAAGATVGGEARLWSGPVQVSAGAVEDGAWRLVRARASAKLGPARLWVEGARTDGALEGFATSADGGLSLLRRATTTTSGGYAMAARARTPGLFGEGWWDASWRWRQAGYEDIGGQEALQMVALRGRQPLGPFELRVAASLFDREDPRAPMTDARLVGRDLGVGFGYERPDWGLRLEARDLEVQREEALVTPEAPRGAFSLGLVGRYRVSRWLQLRAGWRQRLIPHEVDLDDTFGFAGVDVKPSEALEVSLRGGWGPGVGPLAWGGVTWSRGEETWYGLQSMDPDAPSTGDRRVVAGVRQRIGPDASVFAEDVSATDVDGLRLGRAVGVTQRVGDALSLTARYERGSRSTFGSAPDVARDAGGLTVAWESGGARLFGRGEVRADAGPAPLRQWVATAGGEVTLPHQLSGAARVFFTHATRDGHLESRVIDASTSLAWRFAGGAVVTRYLFQRELRGALERRLHLVSLLPAARVGRWLTLSAGGHLGWTPEGAVLSASLRPGVRVYRGLEVGLEGAARTSSPDAGSLTSLRGEVGYRFDERFLLAAGYTVFGFSGTGIDDGSTGSRDRLYLRTEVAY